MVQFATIPALTGARANTDDLVMERSGQTFRINIAQLLDALLSSGAIAGNPGLTATATLEQLDVEGTVYSIPDDVEDVTNVGLPVLTADNYKQIFIDHDTPRMWVGHRETFSSIPAQGTFNRYTNALYRGEHSNNPSNPVTSQFYYNTLDHTPYRVVTSSLGSFWVQASIQQSFGGGIVWLGEQPTAQAALDVIANFVATTRYLVYNASSGNVEQLNNNTYAMATNERVHYRAEPISNPTGLGTINGIVVENGLTGGGSFGVVNIGLDVTSADFPIIPVDHGGTGAATPPLARDNLGLGTVATLDTGTGDGNVPILDASGDLPESTIPDSLTRDSEVDPAITAFLLSALSGNMTTRITVALDAGNKLNLVVDEPTVHTSARLTGDGSAASILDLADDSVGADQLTADAVTEAAVDATNTPTQGQVLAYDATSMRFFWTDPATGLSSVETDSTMIGDGTTGDELGVADDAIDEPRLAMSNSPTNGQVVGWNSGLGVMSWIDQNNVGQGVVDAVFDFDQQLITFTRADHTTFARSFSEINNFLGVAGDTFTGDVTFRAGDSSVVGSVFYLYTGDTPADYSPATILAAQNFVHLPVLDQAGLIPSNLLALGGGTDQVLTRTPAGQAWRTPIAAQGLDVVHSDPTLDGDGTISDPLALANNAVDEQHLAIGNTPVDGYVISYEAANNRLLWKVDATASAGSGLDVVHHSARLSGTGEATNALDLADSGVDTEQLAPEALTEPKVDSLNDPVDGYVLSYNLTSDRFEWVENMGGSGGLTSLETDATLDGEGTTLSPLGVAPGGIGQVQLGLNAVSEGNLTR